MASSVGAEAARPLASLESDILSSPLQHRPWGRSYQWRARLLPRPTHKAASSPSFINLVAVTVISLATVYLLHCYRSLFLTPVVGSVPRALAYGGEGPDPCTGESEGEDDSQDVGTEVAGEAPRSPQPDGAGGPGAQPGVGGPGAGPSDPGLPATEGPKGQELGFGTMPWSWQQGVQHAMRELSEQALKCGQLLPWLRPQTAISLAKAVAQLGAIQIASVAFTPESVQPWRERAAESLIALLQPVRALPGTGRAAQQVRSDLKGLRRLIMRLAMRPTCSAYEENWRYRTEMMSTIQAVQAANTHLQCVVAFLAALGASSLGGPSEGQVRRAVKVLEAVVQVRKQQLLRDRVAGGWAQRCHWLGHKWVLFSKEEIDEAKEDSEVWTSGRQRADIIRAAAQAWGGPLPTPGDAWQTSEPLDAGREPAPVLGYPMTPQGPPGTVVPPPYPSRVPPRRVVPPPPGFPPLPPVQAWAAGPSSLGYGSLFPTVSDSQPLPPTQDQHSSASLQPPRWGHVPSASQMHTFQDLSSPPPASPMLPWTPWLPPFEVPQAHLQQPAAPSPPVAPPLTDHLQALLGLGYEAAPQPPPPPQAGPPPSGIQAGVVSASPYGLTGMWRQHQAPPHPADPGQDDDDLDLDSILREALTLYSHPDDES